MTIKIYNTGDAQLRPSLVMMTYGAGGVGKTTFSSTAPKPLLLDFENGAKYLGLRGIKLDAVKIESWADVRDIELINLIKGDKYETIIIDPIGEAMEILKRQLISSGDRKNVQADGSLTMAGWGYMKKVFRDYIKFLRDCGKHVILIAHIDEIKDEDKLVKRPKIETKISEEIVNMVDVVGYFTVMNDNGIDKRVILVDPTNDKFVAKDRTGQLGKVIEPDFQKIINACQGTKKYSWSKEQTKVEEPKQEKVATKSDSLKEKLDKANGSK